MSAPIVAPRLEVRAPSGVVAHRFGLFAASTLLENVEARALGGIQYEALGLPRVDALPAPCEPTAPPELVGQAKVAQSGTTKLTVGTPFVLYAADPCVLGRDAQLARTQLQTRFLAGEQNTVERVVESGELGNVPTLDEADVLAATTAPNLADAIGMLEAWLAANWGGVGVIHAPRWLAPRAAWEAQLVTSGPRATTVLGSVWSFGNYPGTGPTGQVPDTALWLYATPPVTVRRSALIEPAGWDTGAFDRRTNQAMLLIERVYVVDWPAMSSAAVKTSLTRVGVVA